MVNRGQCHSVAGSLRVREREREREKRRGENSKDSEREQDPWRVDRGMDGG